jgi:hypothetical protein
MSEVEGASEVRQEPQDVSGRIVVAVGVVVVAVGVAAVGIMAWMLHERRQTLGPPPPVSRIAAGARRVPLEQSSIEKTARGQELNERDRALLEQWGWVRPGEVARIPIRKAMDWVIQSAESGKLAQPQEPERPVGLAAEPAERELVGGSEKQDGGKAAR